MKAQASIGLAVGLVFALSTAANATPTLVGTTTDPTGINNLVVAGTTYDVTFSTTTLNSFTNGSALSNAASAALTTALNQLSVTELNNATTGVVIYVVDVDNSLSFDRAPACVFTCSRWTMGVGTVGKLGLDSGGDYTVAADFTAVPTGVPEPWTLALFGAGLAALFMLRRPASLV